MPVPAIGLYPAMHVTVSGLCWLDHSIYRDDYQQAVDRLGKSIDPHNRGVTQEQSLQETS
jgi:hypothetical protein